MKLPNGGTAIIELTKLTEYCLSPTHLRGKHKARVFESVLGITLEHALMLQAVLEDAAAENDAIQGASDLYGTRYIIDFELSWNEKTAIVRSCWIFRAGETSPHFLTCYVL